MDSLAPEIKEEKIMPVQDISSLISIKLQGISFLNPMIIHSHILKTMDNLYSLSTIFPSYLCAWSMDAKVLARDGALISLLSIPDKYAKC